MMFVKIQTSWFIILFYRVIFYYVCSTTPLFVPNIPYVKRTESRCVEINQTIAKNQTPECYCDSKCPEYGDCCLESPFKVNMSKPFQTCLSFVNGSFYVKTECSTDKWKSQCAKSNNSYVFDGTKLSNIVPVTSLKTGITYGNRYCARCQNVSDFQRWNVSVKCGANFSDILTVTNTLRRPFYFTFNKNLTDKLKFSGQLRTYQMTIANRTENCTLSPAVPNSLKQIVRPCYPNVIDKCTKYVGFQPSCSSHQSIYIDESGNVYKNEICALCSGKLVSSILSKRTTLAVLTSTFSSISSTFPSRSTISPLLITRSTLSSTTKPTTKVTTLVPVTTTTRTSSKPQTTTSTTKSSKPPSFEPKTIDRSYLHFSIRGTNCSQLLAQMNMSKIFAQTVYYTSISRTFIQHVATVAGQRVQICSTSNNVTVTSVVTIAPVLPIIFNVVLLLAGVFLGLSLRQFAIAKSSNNQFRYVMSSYAAAMLICNGGWFFRNILNTSVDDLFNIFDDVVNYFGFLTTLMCASTAAFHVTCTSWKAFYSFSNVKGAKWKNLYFYSTINWFVPAVITMLENSANHTLSLSNVKSHLHSSVFLIFPFIVFFFSNLSFYICSAVLVGVEKTVEETLKKLDVNFKYFSALLALTYLMWLTALLLSYSRNYSFVVLFYVLNLTVCVLIYCVANGGKIFATETVQYLGNRSSLVIVNKTE